MQIREVFIAEERDAVASFLAGAGIRLEPDLDYACGLYESGELLAFGGYQGATIKCLAVRAERQGEALLNGIVGELYQRIREKGEPEAFLFTKPGNAAVFQSLGFHALAATKEALFMTSKKNGLRAYLDGLGIEKTGDGRTGAIVMNANPFTKGHRYLIEQAAACCKRLYVFVVREEKSLFPFETRLALVKAGAADLPNVFVYSGGQYMISAATFPNYFLKDPAGAAGVYAELDATIFAERIAPYCGIGARFVGEEPFDPLTALYNDVLAAVLPKKGIELVKIQRLSWASEPISASRVRMLMQKRDMAALQNMLPQTTLDFLQSEAGETMLKEIGA